MTVPEAPLTRDQFPVADRYRYLDHAGIAAPPTVVAHAVARDASAATMLGSVGTDRRNERLEQVRDTCAGLLGTPAEDVTFLRSAAEGLRLLAFGLPWSAGDQVVIADCEYQATMQPWLSLGARGVELAFVAAEGAAWELPLAAYEAALVQGAGRVRVVVVSWVQYARGWRTDLAALAALAHAHGALLVVDVVQGLGVIPAELAAWGVDAALADGHNWLLGPEGIALLYLAPHLGEQLWSTSSADPVGTHPHPRADATPPHRRFEPGSPNRHGIAGLGAATELLAGVGIDRIWTYVDTWCDHLVAGLTDLGATVVSDRSPAGRSAIVTATFGEAQPAELADRLVTYGVIVSGRGDAVRFAPHAWNDADDLAATLHAVSRAWRR